MVNRIFRYQGATLTCACRPVPGSSLNVRHRPMLMTTNPRCPPLPGCPTRLDRALSVDRRTKGPTECMVCSWPRGNLHLTVPTPRAPLSTWHGCQGALRLRLGGPCCGHPNHAHAVSSATSPSMVNGAETSQCVSCTAGPASGKTSETNSDTEKTWTVLHMTQHKFCGQPSFQVPWRGLWSESMSLCFYQHCLQETLRGQWGTEQRPPCNVCCGRITEGPQGHDTRTGARPHTWHYLWEAPSGSRPHGEPE